MVPPTTRTDGDHTHHHSGSAGQAERCSRRKEQGTQAGKETGKDTGISRAAERDGCLPVYTPTMLITSAHDKQPHTHTHTHTQTADIILCLPALYNQTR